VTGRTAALLALAALAAGCRVFHQPTVTGIAEATTLVNPWQVGDARITRCGPGPRATLAVTNPGPAAARYSVTVLFRTDRLAAAGEVEVVGDVPAGAARTADVEGPAPASVAVCSITAVHRS
jgi:hypothetical protein